MTAQCKDCGETRDFCDECNPQMEQEAAALWRSENSEMSVFACDAKMKNDYRERIAAEQEKPTLPDLIVTRGGVPFKDQAEGIRQFKEACLAAADKSRSVERAPPPAPRNENEIIARAYISAAEVFETYASDQIASKRFQSTARDKRDCDTRAAIWNDAAKELREAAAKESPKRD